MNCNCCGSPFIDKRCSLRYTDKDGKMTNYIAICISCDTKIKEFIKELRGFTARKPLINKEG